MFYPNDRGQLQDLVEQQLQEAGNLPTRRKTAIGAMAPHAGLVYSGVCAAHVFGRIVFPDTIVIMSPNHNGICRAPGGVSLWRRGSFLTPLGEVPVDETVGNELLARCSHVAEDQEAHLPEHGIELELPFIHTMAPESQIVPLLFVQDSWEICFSVASALSEIIRERQGGVLVLASSDMTHFESAESAASKDDEALDAVEALDGQRLLEVCKRRRITMCGRAPAAVMVEVARQLGHRSATVVDRRHSGLVSGDFENVVAYAGVVVE